MTPIGPPLELNVGQESRTVETEGVEDGAALPLGRPDREQPEDRQYGALHPEGALPQGSQVVGSRHCIWPAPEDLTEQGGESNRQHRKPYTTPSVHPHP